MTASKSRPRALVLVEHANPEWVSVALVGWSHARALSQLADVLLVTHARNREAFLRAGLREDAQFVAIDTGLDGAVSAAARLLGAGNGAGWSTVAALSVLPYYEFERRVWVRFRERLRAREFDLVHRLLPQNVTTPSLLAPRLARIGVPFVIGPLNGGLPWPRGFSGVRLREREFLGYVRQAYRLMPYARATCALASAIVVGSSWMREQVGERNAERTVYVPENAVEADTFVRRDPPPAPPPLRVAFAGRLVAVKGVDMLLEAAGPLVRNGSIVIDVIGDGPEGAALRALGAREAPAGGITFHGWIPHSAVAERLASAHLFAFPSIRDFGGGAVLEAMASGLVPLVVDYGGPSELVTPRTGFVVPMGERSCIVRDLRQALAKVATDPSGLSDLAERARDRVVRYFTWQAKAAQMLEVYRWAMGERDRPEFGMPFPDPV